MPAGYSKKSIASLPSKGGFLAYSNLTDLKNCKHAAIRLFKISKLSRVRNPPLEGREAFLRQ